MRKICIALAAAFLLQLALAPLASVYAAPAPLGEDAITSKAAILVDAATGTVLFEKNADEALPVASITKVMTLLLIFEALDAGRFSLNDTVTVSQYAAGMGGSQVLLPKPAAAEEDPDQLENDLIRQLELYRQYKQASGLLRQKEQQAALVFYRLPEERYREERIEPGNLTLEKLVAAFEKMQLRLAQPEKGGAQEDHIQRDAFTVREKVLHITQRLRRSGRVGFLSLFEGASTREEVIVTFLALLEMAKNNLVLVEQGPEDKDILIMQRKEQKPDGAEPVPKDRSN